MSHDYLVFLGTVAARTAIVLIAALLGFRVRGKRELGDLNLIDVVMVLLLANAVQNAMTYSKGELSIGIVSAGTLIVVGRAVHLAVVRSRRIERSMAGEPALIVSDGRLIQENMRREQVTEDELMSALREHGLDEPGKAQLVVLETDGTLSVVPRSEQ